MHVEAYMGRKMKQSDDEETGIRPLRPSRASKAITLKTRPTGTRKKCMNQVYDSILAIGPRVAARGWTSRKA